MNDRIPLRVRLIAAGLHGILPGLIGSFLIFLTSLSTNIGGRVNPNSELIVLSNLICGLLLILLLPVISWICWLIVSRIHPTIDLAGKDAINCALNNLIIILVLAFIFGTTCGAINITQSLSLTNSNIIFNSSLAIFDLIAIVYATNSVISCLFSLTGYRLQNRLIYPFIRDE